MTTFNTAVVKEQTTDAWNRIQDVDLDSQTTSSSLWQMIRTSAVEQVIIRQPQTEHLVIHTQEMELDTHQQASFTKLKWERDEEFKKRGIFIGW